MDCFSQKSDCKYETVAKVTQNKKDKTNENHMS